MIGVPMYDALPPQRTARPVGPPHRPLPATIRRRVGVPLRTPDGFSTADVVSFEGLADGREHLALGLGDWRGALRRGAAGGPAPLVRPHSECLTGDVFGSERCDCGPQLREALERVSTRRGLRAVPAAGGPGHRSVRQARRLRPAGRRPRHLRGQPAPRPGRGRARLHVAAQMLFALGAPRVALLANNPDKVEQLERLGVQVTQRLPTGVHASSANLRYLRAKVRRQAHTLPLPAEPAG